MPRRSLVLAFESFLEHFCFSRQDLFWTGALLPRLFAKVGTNLPVCEKLYSVVTCARHLRLVKYLSYEFLFFKNRHCHVTK